MKNYLSTAVILLVISFLISCNDNPSESEKVYKVSGTLIHNNKPIENVNISLNRLANLTTTSNSHGYFEMENVPEGTYKLYAEKGFSDGSFTEINSEILVYGDVILNSLRLPTSITMFDPTDISSSSLKLFWTSSDANDFREYKLYRHSTSGLDENTGELMHVSTSINDTSYVDNSVDPLTEYFYRVYVMNEFGRLGGSNIVSTTTVNQNLIWNGDFELNQPLFNWWDDSIGSITITDSISVSGKNSLYIRARTDDNPVQHLNILGRLSIDLFGGESVNLLPGRLYKLSGWIKTSGEYGRESTHLWDGKAFVNVYFSHNNDYHISVEEDQDWTFLEKEFYAPTESYSGGYIELFSVSKESWYDDIKLELID